MLHMHVSVQWHDEIDHAHVYEMKCTFVEAKHLGCYSLNLSNSCVSVAFLFLISRPSADQSTFVGYPSEDYR